VQKSGSAEEWQCRRPCERRTRRWGIAGPRGCTTATCASLTRLSRRGAGRVHLRALASPFCICGTSEAAMAHSTVMAATRTRTHIHTRAHTHVHAHSQANS
jgi:hypothetical protein